MNKEDALRQLLNYLAMIDTHDDFTPELLALIAGSGTEADVFRLLVMRLTMLKALGIHAVRHKEFENIGGGLYSMHLAGKGFNLRILYAFLANQSPVLLLALHERAGKRKTDYSGYIPQAAERLRQKKEEL